MKEPVLQDKHLEHVKFCKYATALIEKVSGKETNRYSDATLDDIRKVRVLFVSYQMYYARMFYHLLSRNRGVNKGNMKEFNPFPNDKF